MNRERLQRALNAVTINGPSQYMRPGADVYTDRALVRSVCKKSVRSVIACCHETRDRISQYTPNKTVHDRSNRFFFSQLRTDLRDSIRDGGQRKVCVLQKCTKIPIIQYNRALCWCQLAPVHGTKRSRPPVKGGCTKRHTGPSLYLAVVIYVPYNWLILVGRLGLSSQCIIKVLL